MQRGTAELLFIKRAARNSDKWSSHVAFPGGRRDEEDEENARQLLRALAAQVKPVMQEHGMVVKSLNEVRMKLCGDVLKRLKMSCVVPAQ